MWLWPGRRSCEGAASDPSVSSASCVNWTRGLQVSLMHLHRRKPRSYCLRFGGCLQGVPGTIVAVPLCSGGGGGVLE